MSECWLPRPLIVHSPLWVTLLAGNVDVVI